MKSEKMKTIITNNANREYIAGQRETVLVWRRYADLTTKWESGLRPAEVLEELESNSELREIVASEHERFVVREQRESVLGLTWRPRVAPKAELLPKFIGELEKCEKEVDSLYGIEVAITRRLRELLAWAKAEAKKQNANKGVVWRSYHKRAKVLRARREAARDNKALFLEHIKEITAGEPVCGPADAQLSRWCAGWCADSESFEEGVALDGDYTFDTEKPAWSEIELKRASKVKWVPRVKWNRHLIQKRREAAADTRRRYADLDWVKVQRRVERLVRQTKYENKCRRSGLDPETGS